MERPQGRIAELEATIEALRCQAFAAVNPANWQTGDTSDAARLVFYEKTLNEIADAGHEINVLERQFEWYVGEIDRVRAAEKQTQR